MRLPLLVCIMLALAPQLAKAADFCPNVKPGKLSLPGSIKAVDSNREFVVVAMGSSSTEGWMASSLSRSYPAMLQTDLSAALPNVHVAILNRGIGGQDAAEELPRIEPDVVAVKPTLVIWQVGANGALRNSDPKIFKRLVTLGIERLKAAKVDIIIMDNQQSPMILAAPEHALINQSLAEIAKSEGVNLFSRNDLMEHWKEAGFPPEHFISSDGLHHNDLGYACLASALSETIVDTIDAQPVRSNFANSAKPRN
jgi:acyl-CoA thioesterase-1